MSVLIDTDWADGAIAKLLTWFQRDDGDHTPLSAAETLSKEYTLSK